jgi:hypothetical protein
MMGDDDVLRCAVSLRSVAICIIDQDGKVRLERSVQSEAPDLAPLPPGVRGRRTSGQRQELRLNIPIENYCFYTDITRMTPNKIYYDML